MLVTVIKYFAIIYASVYTFLHILNIRLLKKQLLYHISFSILSSIVIAYLRTSFPQYTYFVIVFLLILFTYLHYHFSLDITIISSIISVAISCSVSIFTIIINSFFYIVINRFIYETDIFRLSTFTFIHIFTISLIFKIKRFKNGMPFIHNTHQNDTGIIISLVSLTFISLFTPQRELEYIVLIPILVLIFSSIYIIVWWRSKITQKYIHELKEREISTLNYELSETKAKMEYLDQQNKVLSKIIHKDNKLIPSMEIAITQLVTLSTSNTDNNTAEQADRILSQLKVMSLERRGILSSYENNNRHLPSTNIITIDSLLMLMEKKSLVHSIEYEVKIEGNFDFIKEEKQSLETDLLTLLADLIENAIIATKDTIEKYILVNLIYKDYFLVEIYDSGIPFTDKVITYLGIKRMTTHKKSGGSGIGLMTSYELLKKHSASLIIEELDHDSRYQKKVCVLFNNKNQITIRTNRNDLLLLKDIRTDMQFEHSTDILTTSHI